jgi:eukaryotic-like serine/threonine-protein kinase
MALSAGTRIGAYDILAVLGAGGMGEVYRARDTKLGREVAIKVLPDALAKEADRQARFEREARVLASLNHPNIAAIHGFEEAGDKAFLVMELVPGETLAEQIARGPIPTRAAMAIAVQIADALEAAHARSVIHRDLKPANIKITADGKVKVLDFGLAKALETADGPAGGGGSQLANSPTITVSAATQAGVILGTAAYMSPEQVRGRSVDKRTDIWSFGCVLFEMLTGRQAFAGPTVSDSLAKILEREPSWDALPSATPVSIRRLLRRLLQKDAHQRLHDIADARIDIDEVVASPPETRERSWSSPVWLRAGVAVVAVVALAAGAVAIAALLTRPAATEPPVTRFPVLLPPGETAGRVAASPDGRYLAITTIGPRASVWLRALDVPDVRQLPGTEETAEAFWSPDGRSLGLIGRDRKLRRVDVAGGAASVLADGVGGGTWNQRGVILFGGVDGTTIHGVSASSGAAIDVQLDDGAAREAFRWAPRFLPDGDHFLYFIVSSSQRGTIRVGSLASKETRAVIEADSPAEYSSAGYLLFLRGAVLMAQPFDVQAFRLSGEATPVAGDAVSGSLSVDPSFSASGKEVLAYVRTRSGYDGQLKWFDRSGRELDAIVPPPGSDYLNPSLSPDGTRVAVNSMDPHSGNWDIWTIDLESKIPMRVTSDPAQDSDAVWAPDGNDIVFVSNRGGSYGLYRKRLRGANVEELLLKTATEPRPTDWTRDGRFIVYEVNGDVFALPVDAANRAPIPIAAGPFTEYGASTSADGKWIAYASTESGTYQIYVQPFPGPGEKTRVSTVYGIHPRWRQDGRELVYWAPPDALLSVDLRYDGSGIHAGPPTRTLPPQIGILDVVDSRHHHAMSADGRRFLLREAKGPAAPPITAVLNWTNALGK